MEIIQSARELTKQEKYFLTKAQNIQKMSAVKGQRVDMDLWVMYSDVNQEGEEQEVFALRTPEGEVYATNSPSFIRTFRDILDCFEVEDIKALQILPGTSKAGREFLTCVYAD